MSDKQIIVSLVATLFLVAGVVVFALYNEGILMKNTYQNTLFNYTVDIPRGYQLGLVYMQYLDEIKRDGVSIEVSPEFDVEEVEIAVLTKQDKSKQQQIVDWLRGHPEFALEQLCECVVISTNLYPEPMAALIHERAIKDGKAGTSTPVTGPDGQELPVYTNPLGRIAAGQYNQTEYTAVSDKRLFTDLFFSEPFEFPLETEYHKDLSLSVYGLTLSLFTGQEQTASLQDIISEIKL